MNGKIEDIGDTPGRKISVACDKGFKLITGNEERVCQIKGVWSGEEPECESKQEIE